jgi:tRNA(Ile)-lysidine synthase
MPDLTQSLAGELMALLRDFPEPRRCWIAYSGGLDSTVLLDLLTGLRERLGVSLSAVHVDHGLNPASAAWACLCEDRCAALGVPLVLRRVEVRLRDGRGPEAAARAARYAAFRDLLGPADLLLTAHHRDDQAETLLLALLRGAGLKGLAAMPKVSSLGAGRLVRPLLAFGRADLQTYARARGLDWVEDPSNLDLELDRNWLRRQVLPLLAKRWPAVGRSLARSAGHCAEAATLIDGLAAGAAARLQGERPGTLSVSRLLGIDGPLCRAVLRHWIGSLGLPVPDTRHLARVMGEVLPARPDASPLVAWAGAEVRRYRDDLFALAGLPPIPAGLDLAWERSPLNLPNGLGRLHLSDAAGRDVAPETLGLGPLRVRFGGTGLRCRPLGAPHHRPLKHLYQEAGVPPWLRGYVPLVFAGDHLVAVGDLHLCAEAKLPAGRGVRFVWAGPCLDRRGP